MNNPIENKQININKPDNEMEQDAWKKSIPAQVFLNHFFSINFHIQRDMESYELNKLEFFKNLHEKQHTELESIKQLLLNSWSTEFSLRSTAEIGNEDYLRYALHWTFPQAYYSIMLSLQAFFISQHYVTSEHYLLRRQFSNMVKKGYYPNAIAFYTDGHFGKYYYKRLKGSIYRPSLHPAAKEQDAEAQIIQFLKTTRNMKAWDARNKMQLNPATAIRSGSNGNILQKFSARHWEFVTPWMGATTIIDLMARLKLSAGYHEIERFVKAEVDFELFHNSLTGIVSYLNFVHESYIAKTIGIENYEALIANLPDFLKNGFVAKRFKEKIKPLFVPNPNMENEHLQQAA